LVETLEGIRFGVVSRGGKPGKGGKPEVVLESMTKRQAELAAKLRTVNIRGESYRLRVRRKAGVPLTALPIESTENRTSTRAA
ncbi:MAG: hypothetical protein JRN54_06000, partial [Nitrososphaerota archaeon]|nr:hypothetical protein [Nitrososphaerota archaeon]